MRMPFGRHKGSEVADLPDDYLEWLAGLDDLRQRLREAVEGELERRAAERQARKQAQEPPRTGRNQLPDISVVEELIDIGYHGLVRKHHPDAGGSHERMVAINAAVEWLREKLRGAAL